MKIVLGTRGSDLALWQTRDVQKKLGTGELRTIVTAGDKSLADRLVGTLEKGFFTEELEAELRAGHIDAAVHSLKDLPTRLASDLTIGAILERASARDVIITHPEFVADAGFPLKSKTRVGASSLRREALLKHFAPEAAPEPLRGNVPTRLQKLRDRKVDAIVLAAAGVLRLELDLAGLRAFSLDPKRWVPAPGQGAVAVECRANDHALLSALAKIHHAETASAVAWERAFLRTLEGGCATPFGCYVQDQRAWLGQAIGKSWRAITVSLPSAEPDERFIADTLSLLEKGTNDDDEPLFQPLA